MAGVRGTSALEDKGDRGTGIGCTRGSGVVLRRRTRGCVELPTRLDWDLAASTIGADKSSVEELDACKSDSWEDAATRENDTSDDVSKPSDDVPSSTEHLRWYRFTCEGLVGVRASRYFVAGWSVADIDTVPPHDSRRKGVVPRTAPSFREERITRARCAASRLLVVGGRERVAVLVEAMIDERSYRLKCEVKRKKVVRVVQRQRAGE